MECETGWAKLNLALHVRARRADGYHEIETLFAFVDAGDTIVATPAAELSLAIDGPFAEGLSVGEDNLVLRAARALQAAHGVAAGAALRLTKRLPVASGIGGGSADAAATLRLLARVWGVPLDVRAEAIAAELGADVPACLRSVAARGSGRGDALVTVDNGLSGTPVLLVNPGVAVATGPVFAGWDGVDRGPLGTGVGRNDLQAPAVALAPVIADVLDWLARRQGATLVRMSGSGATCFALFDGAAARDAAAAIVPHQWWCLAAGLR